MGIWMKKGIKDPPDTLCLHRLSSFEPILKTWVSLFKDAFFQSLSTREQYIVLEMNVLMKVFL